MAVTETKKQKVATEPNKKGSGVFAVIKTGGKQYKIHEGQTIKIEKIEGKTKGDKISFPEVLLTDDGKTTKVGAPTISGVSVDGEVLEAGRNAKVTVIHYKQKSRYYKKAGHRQPNLKVKITNIKA